jgi:MinD superfamily P-loop ATPase
MSIVFAIFSTTGGVGVSSIAAYLAYILAEESEVAVVDMIPDFGSLSDFLGFPERAAPAKFPLIFGPESQVLNELSLPRRSHLKLFSMPSSTVSQTLDWKAFFASARKSFNYIILDLPHTYLAPELSVGLDQADQILAVGEFHWATINNLKAFFESCDEHLSSKCKVVITRSEWLPQDVLDECRQNLGQPEFAELPYDSALDGVRKLNEHSPFWAAMKKLALKLQPEVKAP